jgi:hypothetical protein
LARAACDVRGIEEADGCGLRARAWRMACVALPPCLVLPAGSAHRRMACAASAQRMPSCTYHASWTYDACCACRVLRV